ncbi:MAG: hypothetical protein KAI24_24760, partial [Planctomycetes bacterium]|nr:hypothetical protein [Planctomycetota bacterium]
DECNEAFPVVRAGIEQVFVDLRARRDSAAAREQTQKALNALHSKHSQPKGGTGNEQPQAPPE